MSETSARPLLVDCARQQVRVIGALILRELHTRFGRRRFGYLWLFFEPLLLGGMIAVIHGSGLRGGSGIRGTFEFFSIGYVLFFAFRGMINRASSTISSNRGLLYHRQVTLPDLFFARHIIEGVACTGVMTIFTIIAVGLGSAFPDSPMKMLCALGLMVLLAQGVALVVGAVTSEWEVVERFVHAMSYLMLPFSGLFFMVEWLPGWMQDIVVWIPTVHIFELLRDGQFGDRYRATYDLSYVAGWILIPHLLGLTGLRLARQRIGLE
ncbi:ABC transporter permease [Roseomonas terrae]|uniref:ABC transporter permease n=1 Tax=Neoroseomonas terrae TaxID=424799 RepID=A0ABS5EPP8_9PROT|nr:ABC transporter permease [Neoroseomonas terrae]